MVALARRVETALAKLLIEKRRVALSHNDLRWSNKHLSGKMAREL